MSSPQENPKNIGHQPQSGKQHLQSGEDINNEQSPQTNNENQPTSANIRQNNSTPTEENNEKLNEEYDTNYNTRNLQNQRKYDFVKENHKIPSSKSYVISNNGSLIATINETNNFSIYFLGDIAFGHVRCIYSNTDENKRAAAISFINLKNLSYFNGSQEKKLSSSLKKSEPYNYCGSQLAIAKYNEPIIQIFDILNCAFSKDIKITNPIITMKADKLNQEQIFYIEKNTRNLIKYNFTTSKSELISNNVNFFEELVDGSLIMSTQSGIKYFDKQIKIISINKMYLKPMAFFSLSYQKILMIGSTINSMYPSFTVFDPLSKNLEPIYKLPYFKIDDQEQDCIFCCSNDSNKSFYIGYSSSNYVIHCISEGDFYSIEKVENVNFPVMAIHQMKVNNGIVAIFGESTISLLKYTNNNFVIENYNDDEFISDSPQNEEFQEVYQLISELPKPSNKLLYARNLLKNEVDSIISSSDSLERSIKSVLQEQFIAYNLSTQLNQIDNKNKWKSSDAAYFKEKINREKALIRMNLQMTESKKIDQRFANFRQKFSFNFENTQHDDIAIKTEKKILQKAQPQPK